MGQLSKQKKDEMRQKGMSEHEIAYYDAETEKDYESLLHDPGVNKVLLANIATDVTTLPLKILVLQHPNVDHISQKYILGRADKKPYYETIVETFFSNNKNLDEKVWLSLREDYNVAGRLDIATMNILENQSDAISKQKLDVIFNSLEVTGIKDLKYAERYLLAIFEHKNFSVEILDGKMCRQPYVFYNTDILNALQKTKQEHAIYIKMFEITNDVNWLPTDVKNIFIF